MIKRFSSNSDRVEYNPVGAIKFTFWGFGPSRGKILRGRGAKNLAPQDSTMHTFDNIKKLGKQVKYVSKLLYPQLHSVNQESYS